MSFDRISLRSLERTKEWFAIKLDITEWAISDEAEFTMSKSCAKTTI